MEAFVFIQPLTEGVSCSTASVHLVSTQADVFGVWLIMPKNVCHNNNKYSLFFNESFSFLSELSSFANENYCSKGTKNM